MAVVYPRVWEYLLVDRVKKKKTNKKKKKKGQNSGNRWSMKWDIFVPRDVGMIYVAFIMKLLKVGMSYTLL